MVGAQGAFAQVLPAPGGRSIRGRIAVVSGGLILATLLLALIAAVLFKDKTEDLRTVARVIGAGAMGTAVSALIAYFWGMPAAVADFGGKD